MLIVTVCSGDADEPAIAVTPSTTVTGTGTRCGLSADGARNCRDAPEPRNDTEPADAGDTDTTRHDHESAGPPLISDASTDTIVSGSTLLIVGIGATASVLGPDASIFRTRCFGPVTSGPDALTFRTRCRGSVDDSPDALIFRTRCRGGVVALTFRTRCRGMTQLLTTTGRTRMSPQSEIAPGFAAVSFCVVADVDCEIVHSSRCVDPSISRTLIVPPSAVSMCR